jgi:hypothetical protein
MPEYIPTKRMEMGTWLYAHIQYLVVLAKKYRDPTMVIYACFETRNFLEKLECEIILAALTEEERLKYLPEIEKMRGLTAAFGNVIQEKAYTYISFMNALCKAKSVPFKPLGNFDFKISNRYKTELNDYCHLYSKSQNDFEFDSSFIQNGLALPKKIFDQLKVLKVLNDVTGVTITGIAVSALKGDSLVILERWRKKEIKESELVELLKSAKNN